MQGCQMVYFQSRNFYLGTFGGGMQWKILVYFMAQWVYLRSFSVFNDHLVLVCWNKKNLATLAGCGCGHLRQILNFGEPVPCPPFPAFSSGSIEENTDEP
jgi:hypothetical protein